MATNNNNNTTTAAAADTAKLEGMLESLSIEVKAGGGQAGSMVEQLSEEVERLKGELLERDLRNQQFHKSANDVICMWKERCEDRENEIAGLRDDKAYLEAKVSRLKSRLQERKPICDHCWKSELDCDYGGACGNCLRDSVDCVRRWCWDDANCAVADCAFVHSGEHTDEQRCWRVLAQGDEEQQQGEEAMELDY